ARESQPACLRPRSRSARPVARQLRRGPLCSSPVHGPRPVVHSGSKSSPDVPMTPERSCQPCLTVDQAARRDGLLTLLRLRAAITIKGDLADQAAALGRPLPPGCDLTVQERRHAEVMVNDPATVGAQLV